MTARRALTQFSQEVAELLTARQQTITVAESSTGGLISAAMLAVPGASAYFVAGSVVYTARSRKILLQLASQDVEGLEPMTEAMALKFAELSRKQMQTTWGLSELGIAGPTASRYGHAPGISVIAIDGPVTRAVTVQTGSADREDNMWRFTEAAFSLVRDALNEPPPG